MSLALGIFFTKTAGNVCLMASDIDASGNHEETQLDTGIMSPARRSGSGSERVEQDKLEVLNFQEWWMKYSEDQDHPIGGKEWMAAYAAWHYAEILTKQKASNKP